MLKRLRTYSRFVKIEHSVFALPLVFSGVILCARGWPVSFGVLPFLAMAVAAIGARTTAFAFNRIFDAKFDALNPRTAQRELPAKTMTLVEAIGVGCIGAAVYFWMAFILMGHTGVVLGGISLSVFAIYPFMKRFTCLAHFGVGISLAMAPLAGWLVLFCFYNRLLPNEIIGSYDPTIPRMIGHSVLALPYLVLFTFFWVSGFDIIYSTMDEAFDRSQGLHSLPAKFGRKKALWISAFLHVLAFVTLMVLYVSYFRTPVAGVLLGATGVLLFLEQYLAENVDLAFFKINAIISFIVLAFIWSGVAHL